MMKMTRNVLLLAIVMILSGCASSTENLKMVTASKIPDANPAEISIVQVKRGVTNVSWTAKYRGVTYAGQGDDMLRNVAVYKTSGR